MCAVVRLRSLMAWQAARLITNPFIKNRVFLGFQMTCKNSFHPPWLFVWRMRRMDPNLLFSLLILSQLHWSPSYSESNLLELARGLVWELLPNSFSISFSRAADWQNATLFRKSQNLSQLAAWEKKIEKEFGNNSWTSPLTYSKRLDSVIVFV
jgi:hypothetical protein